MNYLLKEHNDHINAIWLGLIKVNFILVLKKWNLNVKNVKTSKKGIEKEVTSQLEMNFRSFSSKKDIGHWVRITKLGEED